MRMQKNSHLDMFSAVLGAKCGAVTCAHPTSPAGAETTPDMSSRREQPQPQPPDSSSSGNGSSPPGPVAAAVTTPLPRDALLLVLVFPLAPSPGRVEPALDTRRAGRAPPPGAFGAACRARTQLALVCAAHPVDIFCLRRGRRCYDDTKNKRQLFLSEWWCPNQRVAATDVQLSTARALCDTVVVTDGPMGACARGVSRGCAVGTSC
jgi:hypothetical protein